MITNICQQEIILEDERVLLRGIVKEDYDNLVSFAVNEPTLWKYSLVDPAGKENMKIYVNTAIENRIQGTAYTFIVFDKQTNEYAGSTRFYDIQSIHKSTLLGYTWYGKKFQRTGLNHHCKFLLLQFCFEQWGLERVEFRANVLNDKSIAAMKSIGCIEEGILRSHLAGADGDRRTTMILSILKDDWFNTAKILLQSKLR
jgi:RimJ/RimL family protein N-acetyltransferase